MSAYESTLRLVRKLNGPASRRKCAVRGCRAQAVEWTWDGTGPWNEETHGDRRVRVGRYLDRYRPMCASHRTLLAYVKAARA